MTVLHFLLIVCSLKGIKKRQLHEREERLKKEEEERRAVDLEWAKVKAEERLQKLCIARNAMLFNTSRFNGFHVIYIALNRTYTCHIRIFMLLTYIYIRPH